MKQFGATPRLLIATAAFAGVIGLAQAQTPPPSTASASATSSSEHASSSTAKQMHDDMMSGMTKMHEMKSTGDADKDYAHMMEHHHEQAIKMTQTYLKGAKDAQLKAWAQKSLQSQQKELDELKTIAPKD